MRFTGLRATTVRVTSLITVAVLLAVGGTPGVAATPAASATWRSNLLPLAWWKPGADPADYRYRLLVANSSDAPGDVAVRFKDCTGATFASAKATVEAGAIASFVRPAKAGGACGARAEFDTALDRKAVSASLEIIDTKGSSLGLTGAFFTGLEGADHVGPLAPVAADKGRPIVFAVTAFGTDPSGHITLHLTDGAGKLLKSATFSTSAGRTRRIRFVPGTDMTVRASVSWTLAPAGSPAGPYGWYATSLYRSVTIGSNPLGGFGGYHGSFGMIGGCYWSVAC